MAGMGKIKALQIWCKNRLVGYRDVEITNMTTSWRDGLAFCALIHRFKPELIDFESLSKENVFENNTLAFEVAQSLGVPALLDAEDMERLETPDKLSIITYVAQLHNCFKDMEPVGGPNVQIAVKRPRKASGVTSPESKRIILPSNEIENSSSQPLSDVCHVCDGKVYLIEKHIADGKMYHRTCFKQSDRKSALSHINKFSSPSTVPLATPSSTDNTPEWQRQLSEKKNARHRLSHILAHQQSVDTEPVMKLKPVAQKPPMRKLHSEADMLAAPLKPSTQRSHSPVTSQKRSFRPVSSGVTMGEKVEKLKQLREQAKSNRSASPEMKARLERLRNKIVNKDASDGAVPPSKDLGNVVDDASSKKTNGITAISKDSSAEREPGNSELISSYEMSSQSVKSENMEESSILPTSKVNEKVSDFKNCDEQLKSSALVKPVTPEANETMQVSELSDGEEVEKKLLEENVAAENLTSSMDGTNLLNENTAATSYTEVTNPFDEDTNDKPCVGDNDPMIDEDTVEIKATDERLKSESKDATNDALEKSSGDGNEPFAELPAVAERPKESESINTPVEEAPEAVATPAVTVSMSNVHVGKTPSPPARPKRAASLKINTNPSPEPMTSTVGPARRLSNSNAVDITVSSSPSNSHSSSIGSVEESNLILQDTVEDSSKNVKPPRPALPKLTKPNESAKECSPAPQKSGSILHTKPPPPRPHISPAVTRKSVQTKQKNSALPRPDTAASGTSTKSNFYVDEDHKTVLEPPPKPARAGANKLGRPSWENALDSWSAKRKAGKSEQSTWYTTDDYPEENNPFGEDEDVAEQEKPSSEKLLDKAAEEEGPSSGKLSDKAAMYDNSLNPFAEDEEEGESQIIVETETKKKVIHANPFEISDDEDEKCDDIRPNENVNVKTRLVPDSDIHINKSQENKSSVRVMPLLPKTRSPGIQKKRAPAPPSAITVNHNNNTSKDFTVDADVDSELSSTSHELTMERTTPNTNTQVLDTPVLRKSKPAPPRPMPPKRRITSEYGLDPDSVLTELEAIEQKQKTLEEQGRQLEEAIRKADDASDNMDDSLLSKWFETINKKNNLVRRENELVFIAKHHELESKQADIEWELRQIMHKAENLKSDADKAREEELLQKLVSIVHDRSKIVDKMDDERLRQQEEDREIGQVLDAKFNSDVKEEKTSKKKDKGRIKEKEDKKEKKGKTHKKKAK